MLYCKITFNKSGAYRVAKVEGDVDPEKACKSFLGECVKGEGYVSAFAKDPRGHHSPDYYGTVSA